MKETFKIFVTVLALLVFVACGKTKKADNKTLQELTARLEKLKAQRRQADQEIADIQAQLDKLAPEASGKSKLVTIAAIDTTAFRHYIDLRGTIDAEDISYISPRLGPGQVKSLLVKQGQSVRKGQLLLKLEDAVVRQQVTAATQQLQGIKTQLAFAKTVYDRQKNLWDQGIGTEVQLINARTNMESLENQLKASTEQVKVAEEQLKALNVYSDVDGIADVVNIRVGEIFTGMTAMGAQIKIVNTHNPKVVINIPENYISKLKQGTPILINVPDAGKTYTSEISLISQSIDPVQRGFVAEAKIPRDPSLKPNQTTVVKILDYVSQRAIVIPVNSIQTDEKGKYVFVAVKDQKGMVAKRTTVIPGEIYGDSVEIKSGIQGGAQLVTEGYQNLYEGQVLSAQP